MRHVVNKLKAVIDIALLLDLSWGVASWSELLTYNLEHALFSLIERHLKLLERLDRRLKEILAQATP